MRAKHGIHIRITYQTRSKRHRDALCVLVVTSDYQNYELGSFTTLLKDLRWKSLKIRRKVDRLCLLKKGLDNNAILPLGERLDICTIDITPQFMLALTYSNSVLCHALLEIRIIYHMFWKLRTMLSSANHCYLRFCRNPLSQDVNNIIHLMNELHQINK